MNHRTVFIATACILAIAYDSHADGPMTINAIQDRAGWHGQHAFELYGSFPTHTQVYPDVTCGGARALARIDYASSTQINVFIAEPGSNSSCTFALQRITDGTRSNAYGPVRPSAPEIEIQGTNDRGVTEGRRFVELYGRFADFAQLEPRVHCAGVLVPALAVYTSQGQINISMPDAGPAQQCTIVLRRTTDGRESPVWGTQPARTNDTLVGFGGYWWGGIAPSNGGTVAVGQRHLANAGFDVARMLLTPQMRSGNPVDNYYALDFSRICTTADPTKPDTNFLSCLIRSPAYQEAISLPSLRTIIFTTYDTTSVGNFGGIADFLNPKHPDEVRLEYQNLALALYETQHDTGKTFVIGQWEGDNGVYCGSAYSYVVDLGFRGRCDQSATPPTAGIEGMTQWFLLRKEGIRRGRELAAQRGLAGVYVGDAVEFNSIRFLQNAGFASVLDKIKGAVKPDFALYSSYDSQNAGLLDEDLARLRQELAPSELLVGEVGFPNHGVDGIDAFRTVEVAKAVQRAKLRAAILWEAFDTPDDKHVWPFGVLDVDGKDRPVMTSLRAELAAQARELAAPSDLSIRGINDRGITVVAGKAYRYYELYGTFSFGPIAPTVICDGTDARAEVTYSNELQMNIRIPHEGRERFCVFRVARGNGARSLAFGPKVAADR